VSSANQLPMVRVHSVDNPWARDSACHEVWLDPNTARVTVICCYLRCVTSGRTRPAYVSRPVRRNSPTFKRVMAHMAATKGARP
jgi:hypothetical protein